MVAAFLFDLDGTLSNTDPIHLQTWEELLRPYGLELTPAFYREHFSGRRNQEIIADLLPQLSAEEGEAMSWEKEATFRRIAATQLTLTPGFMDLLDWIDRHQLKRAVVTNAPRENADFMLQTLHLTEALPIVILGDELPQGKPDPLPYQIGLQRLNVTAKEAIAVEDSPSGLRSAIAAGIPTVGIASTHPPADLYQLGATLVIQDFTETAFWDWLTERQMAMAIG